MVDNMSNDPRLRGRCGTITISQVTHCNQQYFGRLFLVGDTSDTLAIVENDTILIAALWTEAYFEQRHLAKETPRGVIWACVLGRIEATETLSRQAADQIVMI